MALNVHIGPPTAKRGPTAPAPALPRIIVNPDFVVDRLSDTREYDVKGLTRRTASSPTELNPFVLHVQHQDSAHALQVEAPLASSNSASRTLDELTQSEPLLEYPDTTNQTPK
ncbi:hypothetical protein CVT26_007460 [Gymnopilus dilepis]|uniref:Uncharacterized protein n=1 Tax=Gymnopilus dilepis TaxID=231916 RepID=A0A409WLE6_9AGAR|nr:hypothetical protein CVT26_007460 [Gymnopilus dilepis]